MTKRLLVAFLTLNLTMHIAGCTSAGGEGDTEVAESNDGSFAEEGNGDFAEGGADGNTDVATDAAPSADGAVADNLDDIGSDGAKPDGATDVADAGNAAAPGDELVLDTAEPLPEDAAATDPAGEAMPGGATDQVAANPAPTDEPVFNTPAPEAAPAEAAPLADNSSEALPGAAVVASEPEPEPAKEAAPEKKKSFAPMKKIREQAFAAADGTSLNRVYIARPGDSLKSVSKKIFGKDRSKDLKAWNGKASIKTGDKIYYPSPKDAADTSMKVFYEDIGIQPSVYTSKDGDNIRAISKGLLGNKDSWKEVWASNASVESKGDIPSGLEIRYWPEGSESAVSAPAMAAKSPSKSAPKMDSEPAEAPPVAANTDMPPSEASMDMPPPAPTTVATNDMPPPPPPPPPTASPAAAAVGAIDPNTGAPTGNQNLPPPPPPPPMPTAAAQNAGQNAGQNTAAANEPKPVAKKMQAIEKESEPDADQMMWLMAGGIMLMAAAVLYVVIKKNRAKRIDFSQTQV